MSERVLDSKVMPSMAPALGAGFGMRLQKFGLNATLLSGLLLLATDSWGRYMGSPRVTTPRLDLQIGFVSVLFPFIFGSLVGIATGYLGGRLDTLFMRLVDVLMAFPFLVLVVAIMSVLGPGLVNLYVAFGAVSWVWY